MLADVPIEVCRFATAEDLGVALAEHLAAVPAAAEERRECLLGWPAGRTPQVVVDGLITLAATGRLDLRHVTLVLMDEYLDGRDDRWRPVPLEAHFSCRGFVVREVLAPLDAALPAARRLRREALWSPDPADPAGYDERITAAGGIDLFVVASGTSDGHVAFNPPGSDPRGRTSIVRIAETTRRDNLRTFPGFAGIEQVPTHGVSVGLATIAAARELAVVMHGPEKRPAAAALLEGTGFRPEWPATIALDHPRARLWLDAAASGASEG